ncbi:two-component system chemotaxis response regulator CheV [Vibrio sp. ES.051]|uniref:chemotaxis protein n=1 Tax=Vibrio sp. ES.051 TaxID=1761909 RepID=UPI000BF39CA7|nr:chemotaxis protein [Vibrio sp. ES.051]PFG58045.1 two-component system chemotaxis response regulator CheV [Vibrio sp. ES.051]
MPQFSEQSQGVLMFRLHTKATLFALGTMKIKGIVPYQAPTVLPACHAYVIGSVTIRDASLPVIDLSLAMGGRGVPLSERGTQTLIVADCMRMQVALMVDKVEHIVSCDWKSVTPLPKAAGQDTFVLGSTHYNDQLVQLLDVERVLTEIFPADIEDAGVQLSQEEIALLQKLNVLVVDDSIIARRLMSEILDRFGLKFQLCHSGDEALALLLDTGGAGVKFDMVISDIEMPGLDGYELIFALNDNPRTRAMYKILHTSLSSEMSQDRARQVGANDALSKFNAQALMVAMSRGAEVALTGTADECHDR